MEVLQHKKVLINQKQVQGSCRQNTQSHNKTQTFSTISIQYYTQMHKE